GGGGGWGWAGGMGGGGGPRPAAAFLDAYARAGEAGAEAVASPLYAAEWERRGLSPADRRALHAAAAADAEGEWVHFAYLGGAVDRRAFVHLLYLARPAGPRAPSPASVWRVDADPAGRVIWLELVYLFARDTPDLTPV